MGRNSMMARKGSRLVVRSSPPPPYGGGLGVGRSGLWLFWLGQQLRYLRADDIPGMGKKRREWNFERIVQDEKPYKRLLALKEVLAREPERVVPVPQLGLLRRTSGRKGDRRFAKLIRRYPAIFDVYRDSSDKVSWCGFTDAADDLVVCEATMRAAYEPVAVTKLRKLLMMCPSRRLPLSKFAHLKHDFGFPDDLLSRMVYSYPEFFRVVDGDSLTPLLELTSWDPSLAVSVLEERAKAVALDKSDLDPRFTIALPSTVYMTRERKARFEKFHRTPYISPYADASGLLYNSPEFEKRNVAIMHEILSLTLEKKTIYDNLTHYHKEMRLPQSILALLLRHYGIFYVSRKGNRLTAFLKEAYEGTRLIESNEWVRHKEKFLELMEKSKEMLTKCRADRVPKHAGEDGDDAAHSGSLEEYGESSEEEKDTDSDSDSDSDCENSHSLKFALTKKGR